MVRLHHTLPICAALLLAVGCSKKEQARETKSKANLRQIGIVLFMYAQENDFRFPKKLQETKKYYVNTNPKMLESPRKPKDFSGPSYIYIPGLSGTTRDSNKVVVVYENPAFCADKINVLFADYHVDSLSRDRFLEALEATYKLLGKEMPEIKFKD